MTSLYGHRIQSSHMASCPCADSSPHRAWLEQNTASVPHEADLRRLAKDAGDICSALGVPSKLAVRYAISIQDEVERKAISYTGHSNATNSTRDIENTLKNAMGTAYLVDVSPSHRAAACNAICAIIEAVSSSLHAGLRRLLDSECLWFGFLRIYLDRFNRAKAKCLRQVLTTLLSMLSKCLDGPKAERFRVHMMTTLLGVIFGRAAYPALKPALHALKFLLHGESISVTNLLNTARVYLSLSFQSSEGEQSLQHIKSLTRAHQLCDRGRGLVESEAFNREMPALELVLEVLLHSLLGWVLHVEVAAAAGHLFVTFLDKLRVQKSAELEYHLAGSRVPCWAACLRQSVNDDVGILDVYKHHILPRLFKISAQDDLRFLESLQVVQKLNVDHPQSWESDVLLLFTALQVMREHGISEAIGMKASSSNQLQCISRRTDPNVSGDDDQKQLGSDIEDKALEGLLYSQSSLIRLSALSLLTAPTISKKLFASSKIQLLKVVLPYFHAEMDVGARAEFLLIMKRFFERLRASLLYLRKQTELDEGKWTKTNHAQDESRLEKPAMPIHCYVEIPQASFGDLIQFLKWYISSIKFELQPTSSYQVHITALSLLMILVGSSLHKSLSLEGELEKPQERVGEPLNLSLHSPGMDRVLLDLIMDPFEDIRERAANILKKTSEGLFDISCVRNKSLGITGSKLADLGDSFRTISMDPKMDTFVDRTSKLMNQTGRVDHSDGFAHSIELAYDQIYKYLKPFVCTTEQKGTIPTAMEFVEKVMKNLEMQVTLALNAFDRAITGSLIHGLLMSLRLVHNG